MFFKISFTVIHKNKIINRKRSKTLIFITQPLLSLKQKQLIYISVIFFQNFQIT